MQVMASIIFVILLIRTLGASATSTPFQLALWNDSGLQKHSANSSCLVEDSCPVWAHCNISSGSCECYGKYEVLICGPREEKSYILMGYCLTYNNASDRVELGLCFYNNDFLRRTKYHISTLYSSLPQNASELEERMCGAFNRTGTLCGKCSNYTYLRAYSYDLSCYSCENEFYSFVKYVLIAYASLTLFCFIILIFQINIPSSKLQGYVFFCLVLASPMSSRSIMFYLGSKSRSSHFKIAPQIIGTLYGIWNLDFFRLFDLGICFRASSLTIFSLDILVALYPLALMLLIYGLTVMCDSRWKTVEILTKPLQVLKSCMNLELNVRTSVVDGFATFMFLSHVKFVGVCFDLLAPVQVCNPSENETCKFVVLNDATIDYFSREHIPFALLALFIFIMLVLIPILTLAFYPLCLCQRCLSVFPRRWQIALHYFVDAFQGCYKDGTEPGSKDCRWFSVVPFIALISIFSIYEGIFFSTFLPFCSMILVLATILTIVVDPHKPQFKHHSDHFTVFLILLSVIMTCAEGLHHGVWFSKVAYTTACLMGLLHQLYLLVLAFYFIKNTILSRKVRVVDKTVKNLL